MKKNYFTLIMAPLFLLATGFIILRYTNPEANASNKVYQLQKRKAESSNGKEFMRLYKQAEAHLDKLRETPADTKSKLALASIFIEESRAFGNHAYYDEAALHYVKEVLQTEPKNFEASVLKSVLLLSQHRFEEARAEAEKTKQLNPYNAYVYGILTDANVELGNYKIAVENADQMVSIRPDIRSYSRVAYLREIYGDYPGAIEAMKMAVSAGVPGDEATVWTRVQLARLFENTGLAEEARMQYIIALEERPGYAYAMAGLGRLLLHQNKTDEAIQYFKQADALIDDVVFNESMVEAYTQKGDKKQVAVLNKEIIKAINDHKHSSAKEDKGHYHAGMELAYAYVASGNYKEALSNAMAEHKRRPLNIDVNECVAWVYYKKGEAAKAVPFIETALVTNSVHPRLLARAALIYNQNNQKQKAATMLTAALSNNAVMEHELKKESTALLAALK
jgi:tetratricopeptide (TPR) repeat protein